MKLELWMMLAAGLGCAAGFGSLAVLMLGLDAQVRRLSRQAAALQSALENNLKAVLSEPVAAAPAVEPAQAPAGRSSSSGIGGPPPMGIRAPEVLRAVASPQAEAEPASMGAPSFLPAPPPSPGAESLAERWTAERRLLVMRLAARGNPAEQIAAALRIPRAEIELFIRLNRLDAPSASAAAAVAGLAGPSDAAVAVTG